MQWLYGATGWGTDLWMEKNGRCVGAADASDVGKPVTPRKKNDARGWGLDESHTFFSNLVYHASTPPRGCKLVHKLPSPVPMWTAVSRAHAASRFSSNRLNTYCSAQKNA